MIKKIIINMFLIAFMLNSPAVHCFAAEAAESDYKLQTLAGLGIISKDVDPESFVTRGEFIDIAVKLRNCDGAVLNNNAFEDISEDYEYYESIEIAARYGLIKGDGKQINAGSIITASQVQTILLRVLGYINLDEKNIDAISKKINKPNIKSGAYEMTWDMVVRAVYDVLELETVAPTPSGGNIDYNTTDKLLLEDYHDIYTEEGIVEGVGETLLTGEAKTGRGVTTINGKQFSCDDSKMQELLGRRVKFYYKRGDGSIIFAREYKNNVIVLCGEDIEYYKDNKLGYEYNNKTKYAKISVNADIVYNDRYSEAVEEKDLMSLNAEVTLTDNNSDGYFDVIIVKKYDICIADSVESTGKDDIITLKYPVGSKIKIVPDEIVDESLNEIDIREIMQNDVLCVYESRGSEYVRAVLCNRRISGVADSIIDDGDKNMYAVINGEKYRFSEECLKNQKNLITSKTDGIFVLDINKRIAYINKFSDSFHTGYVIDSTFNTDDEIIFFKILTEYNEIKTININEKAVLNGTRSADKLEFWNRTGGKDYRHRLIRYKLNSDNEIKVINDTDSKNSDDFFEKYYSNYELKNGVMQKKNDNEKHYYKSYSKIIANRISVDNNTVVMIVPDSVSETDEKYYLCENISYLVDDREYRVEAYRTSRDEFTADVIIIYDDVSSDYSISDQNTGISVLDNVFVTINNEDEAVDGIVLWDNGVKYSYPMKDNVILKSVYEGHTPARGDIIRYSLREGMINKLELIYSAADDTMVAPTSVTHKNDNNKYTQFRVWDAYVFYRWGSNLLLSDTMPNDYNNFSFGDYYTHSCASSSIIICDISGKGDISIGTMDNLIGYKNTMGAECSRVVLYERYGEGITIVIYK